MGKIGLDSKLYRILNRIGSLIVLNIVFVLCCIPVVTIGAAVTGMYSVALKMAENEEGYILRDYGKAFCRNLKQASIIWLLILAAGILLGVDSAVVTQWEGMFSAGMRILLIMCVSIGLVAVLYVFPTLAKFEDSIGNTFRNAFLIGMIDLPQTLMMLCILAAAVKVTVWNVKTLQYGIFIWLYIGFSLMTYVHAFLLNKIYRKYIGGKEK